MKSIKEWLSGYKTYIVMVGYIITAIGAYAGDVIDLSELINRIIQAIGGITFRAGIAKAGKKEDIP